MGQLMEKVDQVGHDVGEIKRSLQWQNGRVRQLELWRSGLIAAWGTVLLIMGVLAWIVESGLKAQAHAFRQIEQKMQAPK